LNVAAWIVLVGVATSQAASLTDSDGGVLIVFDAAVLP
jgi:hypothetical protein